MPSFELNRRTPMPDRQQEAVHLAREADFRLGDLVVRPSKREVVCTCGAQALLEPRVMQVLVALARMGGRVVSRDELIDSCWGGRIVGEDAINRCIGRLRKIAAALGGGFRIETIARVGYRLAPRGSTGVPEGVPMSAQPAGGRVRTILARLAQSFGRRTQRA